MNGLIELVGELVDAIELREAAEPDLGSYVAEARIRALERRLAAEYRLILDDEPILPDAAIDDPRLVPVG